MRIVNTIGSAVKDPDPKYLAPYLERDSIDAVFYYTFGSGYSGMGGDTLWSNGKPIIGGRYSLWGNGTSGM